MDFRIVVSRFERIFIAPVKNLHPKDNRRTAKLLASFLLVIIALMSSLRLIAFLTDPNLESDLSVVIGMTLLFSAYLLSRTKFYRLGAWLMIAPIPVITLISIISGADANPQTTLIYLIIALLLASIFFSRTGIISLITLNLVVFLILPLTAKDIFPTYSSIISPLAANLVTGALIIVFMTHRAGLEKDRQQELQLLNEELKESEASLLEFTSKLESLVGERTTDLKKLNDEYRSFAYSISHDLRAPIRAISGFSQVLIDTPVSKLTTEEQQYMYRIHRAAERMEEMIEALLKLSRISQGKLEVSQIDLSAMARSVFNELKQEHAQRVITFDVQKTALTNGDKILLRLVLQNLIGNAIKFTRDQEFPAIKFSSSINENQFPVYCLTDNGVGFDAAQAKKLFYPFQRLHPEADYEGIGIGLATVQRIIHQHNGQIWAESTPNNGASFFFTLNPSNLPSFINF
jgi:signal transduction histidine kinase